LGRRNLLRAVKNAAGTGKFYRKNSRIGATSDASSLSRRPVFNDLLNEPRNDSDDGIGEKETSKNPQKVNRNVSFHAIKMEALNILFSDMEIEKVLSKLRALFLTNPTLDKKKPKTERKKKTDRVLLHYHRRQRKHGF